MDSEEVRMRDDFRVFLWAIWKLLNLPDPTPIQYDIALWLQKGPRRRMVMAFRGIGKSWITAAYVLWRLYKNANERILVVSASKDRSDAFSVFVKRLIDEVPFLQHLRPREDQRSSNLAFDVGPSDPHQAPSVRSVGIKGQLTGGRATVIVADDVEVPKNSMTQTMRDQLSELVKEFDAVLVPDGEIIYLGTPQSEMSLYNVLTKRGYVVRIWPSEFPAKDRAHIYEGRLAPFLERKLNADPTLAGKPTDTRFPESDLREREASYGRSGYALQFLLDTSYSDKDRYPLKLSDLIVMDVPKDVAPSRVVWGTSPELVLNDLENPGLDGDRWHRPMWIDSQNYLPYTGVVMAIDPAGRGGDELGVAIVAMLNGFLYVLLCKGLAGGYTDPNLEQIARWASQYQVRDIVIEENFGDGMFSKLLRPFMERIHPCSMEEIKHSVQKEKRIIDTLEPVMNQHKLVVSRELIEGDMRNYNGYGSDFAHRYSLFYQLTRITKEKDCLTKYDRVDVLAMAVKKFSEDMGLDADSIEERVKARKLDEELEKFMASVLGEEPHQPSWNEGMLN